MNDALHQLLQNPRVWRGTDQAESPGRQGFTSGYPRLDRHLPGGGWPQHALTEILLEHYGSGELKLLMPALARLSQAGDSDVQEPFTEPCHESLESGDARQPSLTGMFLRVGPVASPY